MNKRGDAVIIRGDILCNSQVMHDVILHDMRFDYCPLCWSTSVRECGELSRRNNEGAPTMRTYVSMCPEHSVIVCENDDWGGSSILYRSDGVKYA
jgi:hypothetical protein